jgi:hypothetical protein
MNDYDKAGRYLIKRDSGGFFRWFLDNPSVQFQAWIDARRVALPNQKDLTNDLVAAVANDKAREAICLELEAEARADALTRLLGYFARFWSEPTNTNSISLMCASGAVLDLTGRNALRELNLLSAIAPGCRLELTILRRCLANENAAAQLAGVDTEMISPWQLAWVPLMRGGGELAIIGRWMGLADRLLVQERDRADLGTLVLTFATLAGCRAAWQKALRGWNMQTSPFLDEIRAKVREEAHEEGRAEGVRATLLRLGRQKFNKAPTKKQQKELEGIKDPAQLEALAERLLTVESWADLLAGD